MIESTLSILDKVLGFAKNHQYADLKLAIADLKIQISDLQNENLELKNKLKIFTERNLTLKPDGIYYDQEGIPFCPACFSKGTLVPLRRNSYSGDFQFDCPNCLAHYMPRFLSNDPPRF
jgi:hypothetical protein